MSKVILVEYDAKSQSLKLPEPLPGVEDHEKLKVAIEKDSASIERRPWMALRGSLPAEAAEELARNLAEAAAPDEP
jgi:hypothetical protein